MSVHASDSPELKTASTHPIQYYLSLPEGWTAEKKWPVVVVIDSADREFLQAAKDFAQARRVDEAHISSAAERGRLPVRNFIGTKDQLCSPGQPIYTQMQRAISVAKAHGYGNVTISTVEGKGHERLAEDVLAYFSSLIVESSP